MKTILLVSLILLVSCGKNKSSKKVTPAPAPETTLTPTEEEVIVQIQQENELPESSVELMRLETINVNDPYTKARLMFCVGRGASTVVDFGTFHCRSFKGDKIRLFFTGAGLSFGVHADVLVLYPKKKSRALKEGTYNVNLGALHLGLGVLGLSIRNQNESINWRMKGLGLGIGLNNSFARMTIEKL